MSRQTLLDRIHQHTGDRDREGGFDFTEAGWTGNINFGQFVADDVQSDKNQPLFFQRRTCTVRNFQVAFAQRAYFAATAGGLGIGLDRLTFCLRKRAEREADVYFPSLSCRTIVYKGMLTTGQLEPFFPDLSDRRFETQLALVHSRFSTNTFPSWPLAQPIRLLGVRAERLEDSAQGIQLSLDPKDEKTREAERIADLISQKFPTSSTGPARFLRPKE